MKLATGAIAVLAILSLGSSAARAQNCPPSPYQNYVEGCPSRYPYTYADSTSCPLTNGGGYGLCGPSASSYDIRTGRLHADATGCEGDWAYDSDASSDDLYTLMGPSGTGPITFQVILTAQMDGTSGQTNAYPYWSQASMKANLAVNPGPSGSSAFVQANAVQRSDQHVTQDASVPLTLTAGQTFRLRLDVSATSQMRPSIASVTAQLHFSALPTGYSIVSCQGYSFDAATAVSSSSWGRIKIRYR